jgi:Rps23 Pro-64 3,4-dihydroxylase Tpa1-like proline 4-hydroxylase
MVFLNEMDPATGLLDARADQAKGKDLAETYKGAQPFPHIVIDDFLPRPILDMCLREFSKGDQDDRLEFDRAQERFKRAYKPDTMSADPRRLFYAFNSRPFVSVLENITGIKGLIPDPYFLGGGFHEISEGGHLSIHADFNHHKLMDVERRINVLIYLNEGWKPEYGGQLELWDKEMTHCLVSIVPEFNRCVIFSTTSSSYHGNPQPVRHPDGVTRKSIALYYYTSTWDGSKRDHTTQFRVRPGSSDKPDWKVQTMEVVNELVPPIAFRLMKKIRRKNSLENA